MFLFNIVKNLKRDKESLDAEMKESGFLNFGGSLEIYGYKNGKQFYYDKDFNTISLFAKHATMHLLTGEIFINQGESRNEGTHGGGDTVFNSDGTMVSGKQYFAGDSLVWWASDNVGGANYDFGYFPSKMLFGTGKEGDTFTNFTSEEQSYYGDLGWDATNFDSNISSSENDYSNIYSGDTLHKRKSINEMTAETKTTPTIQDSDFAITGAIKHGLYENDTASSKSTHLDTSSGSEFLKKEYSGIGHPCLLYAKRDARYYQSGSEVALSFDEHIENKITFTVTMPEQTGENSGMFYPYNGHTLKEAGLFTDARFLLSGTVPTQDSDSDDSPQEEFDNFTKMPYGLIVAKRYIAPITKSHDVSITCRWTIYL